MGGGGRLATGDFDYRAAGRRSEHLFHRLRQQQSVHLDAGVPADVFRRLVHALSRNLMIPPEPPRGLAAR